MNDQKPRFDKLLLGLAIGGLAIGARLLSRPRGESTIEQLKKAARKGWSDAVRGGAEFHRQWQEEREELKRRIGDGAHDPGAIVHVPKPDEQIYVEKYGFGIAGDRQTGTLLNGSLWGGYYPTVPAWTLVKREGNHPVVAHFRGHFSKGWDGMGEALAITIHHAFPDGFFPHRDAIYADSLPLDRVAMMLRAAHRSPEPRGMKTSIVLIDNRESHRSENERLANQEDPQTVLGPNGTFTAADQEGAAVWLGSPDPRILHDRKARETRDPRSGLRLVTNSAGDRDYSYTAGTLYDGEHVIARLTLHVRRCWRPGYGECRLINLNRAYGPDRNPGKAADPMSEAELPFASIAPLLNADESLFWQDHIGHAVVVDTRSNPIRYYYG